MPPHRSLSRRTADRPPALPSQEPAARAPIAAAQQRVGNAGLGVLLRSAQPSAPSQVSTAGQNRAYDLSGECLAVAREIGVAQIAHASPQRSEWLQYITEYVLDRIANAASDAELEEIAADFHAYVGGIREVVADAQEQWTALELRYKDERDWLVRRHFDDATLAAKQLDDVYVESKRWIDRGARSFLTSDDFAPLATTFKRGTYYSTGVLQASRARARQLADLLDTVRDLRWDDEDPNRYVPGWSQEVDNELANLSRLATHTRATPGTDFPAEFSRLRAELVKRRDDALAEKPKAPLHARIGAKIVEAPMAVVGAGEAVVGPLVEAVAQVIDLLQIVAHFGTGGRFSPTFLSNLSKAAEQGATTTELLKGMVTGLLLAPERFLEAVKDGDWEAMGREAVNLWMLKKLVEASPEYVRRAPALLTKMQRALHVLRARVIREQLSQPRLAPQSAVTQPKILHTRVPGFARARTDLGPDVDPMVPVPGFGRTRADVGAAHDVSPKPGPFVAGPGRAPQPPGVETPKLPPLRLRRVGGFARESEPPVEYDPNLAGAEPPSPPVKGFRPRPKIKPNPSPKRTPPPPPEPLKVLDPSEDIPDEGDFVIRFPNDR